MIFGYKMKIIVKIVELYGPCIIWVKFLKVVWGLKSLFFKSNWMVKGVKKKKNKLNMYKKENWLNKNI